MSEFASTHELLDQVKDALGFDAPEVSINGGDSMGGAYVTLTIRGARLQYDHLDGRTFVVPDLTEYEVRGTISIEFSTTVEAADDSEAERLGIRIAEAAVDRTSLVGMVEIDQNEYSLTFEGGDSTCDEVYEA